MPVADSPQAISPALQQAVNAASEGAVDAATRLLALSREPVFAALVERIMNAVDAALANVDQRTAGRAAGERTDVGALIRVLEEARPDPASHGDPFAAARLRWIRDRQQLLEAEGGVVHGREVESLLGISRQAVAKARAEGRLVGLPAGPRQYVYPAWQFGPSGPLRGLRELRRFLGEGRDPWALVGFVLAPNTRLNGEAPLAVLRRGEVEPVLRAASAHGKQGAA